MALHEGVKVRSITLFFLGGFAQVDRECPSPMGTFRIALAGPLVSILLAIFLFNIVGVVADISPIASTLLIQLANLNFVLALLNLLPCLPLDGGVILKSLVWHFTGSQSKGLKAAISSGRLISFGAIFLGFFICFSGGGFQGLWLILLGWLGLASSRSQNQSLTLQKILCELKVEDGFGRRFRVIEEDQSLQQLSELRLKSDEKDFSDWVLVCRAGRWVGYVTDQPLKELPVQYWNQRFLSDYTQPLSDLPSVSERTPLWQAVVEIEKSEEGKLLVFNLAGLPSGTLDRVDVGKSVLNKLGLKIPQPFLEVARKENNYPLGLALPKIVEMMIASGIVKKALD